MDFKDIFEQIQFELILEGLGAIFGFFILWQLFFSQEFHTLLTLFITSIC